MEATYSPSVGWQPYTWNVSVPARFAIAFTIADDYLFGTSAAVATDGPACGVCFPTTRAAQSYLWGTESSVLCPGFATNDGNCNVEWLARATLSCSPVAAEEWSIEDRNWSRIKALYR